MLNISIITLSPKIFYIIKELGIINKAIKKNLLNINIINLREFSYNKYKSVDSCPYGGGGGMLIMCKPILDSINFIKKKDGFDSYVIYLSPQGKIINQLDINRLYKKKSIIILCGKYEGIDERLFSLCIDEEISIGDYVLSCGEIPALVLIDLISRRIPGVLNSINSLESDSFFDGLLDYPSYTKPRIFLNLRVPKILLSGNHYEILKWRNEKSLKQTWMKKPELLLKKKLSKEQLLLIKSFKDN